MSGRDTVGLLPTGGGKSLCFQIPALAKEGICIVVSPLIALMKDQVAQLKKRDIRAAAIFSGLTYHEIDVILDNCQFGYYKLLYVSPERLKTELFIERFKRMKVNLIAVDEAHCVSQWGYDFRPPYLEIAEIRKHHPEVPVLALTASATPEVQEDIVTKLALKKPAIFKKSFARPNLRFVVRQEAAKFPKLMEIISKLKGSGIVYARNRNKTRELAMYLQKNGISADFYHAGLNAAERNKKQEAWMQRQTQVIVCTNAFGMGIDKSDVRWVAHVDVPDSMEAYYQEAGRAGRDGHMAYAVLLYTAADIAALQERNELKFPAAAVIKRVYNALCNHFEVAVGSGQMRSYPFDIVTFCRAFNLDANIALNALKILEQSGYMQLSEGVWMPSRAVFRVDKPTLYRFEVAHSEFVPIIKALLRMYGGILDHYSKINELQLARQLNCSAETVTRYLKMLHQHKIITYVPASDEPTVMLLTERLHDDNLYLNERYLAQRKQVITRQLKAMTDYVENTDACRQMMFCRYFGETEAIPCGQCDVCLEKKKQPEYLQSLVEAQNDILQKVGSSWIKMVDLLPQDAYFKAEIYKDAIRMLLDEKQLEMNEKNELKKL